MSETGLTSFTVREWIQELLGCANNFTDARTKTFIVGKTNFYGSKIGMKLNIEVDFDTYEVLTLIYVLYIKHYCFI